MRLRTIMMALLGLAGSLATACSGSIRGTGGSTSDTGGSTGDTGASTSGTVPATPDTAWVVNMTGGTGCALADSMVQFGDSDVNASAINMRVTDGELVMSVGQTASVACAVTPLSGGGFEVQAQTSIGADSLQVNIPNITVGATMAQPVVGSVTYISTATVSAYEGKCNFYFASPNEGVASGKLWSAFTCAGLTDASSSPPSICPVVESYFVVENCGS